VYLFGIALFGGLFVWMMIFITHLRFRRKWESAGMRRLPVRMIGYPWTSVLGALSVAAIIATTWWVPGMRPTILSGLPWLAALTLGYLIHSRLRKKTATSSEELSGRFVERSAAVATEKQ
jgi:L-asparagine transporter-like permease